MVDVPEPNFFRAGQRAERAAVQLNELSRLANEAIERIRRDPLVLTIDRQTYERRDPPEIKIKHSKFATRDTIRDARLLGSEIVNHLRTALDYVVYDLAWLDSGSPKEKTRFPIQTTEVGYGDVARKAMRGVSPEHRAVVRTYQPFEGCEWTETLARLSNSDKHSEPMTVDLTHSFKMQLSDEHVSPDPDDPSRLIIDAQDQTFTLLLSDGRDAATVLRDLTQHVAGVINRFRAEIGASTLEIEYRA
jgi:hypothetical protein